MPRQKKDKKEDGQLPISLRTVTGLDAQTQQYFNQVIDLIEADFDANVRKDNVRSRREDGIAKRGRFVITPYEIATKGIAFFRFCLETKQPITMSGLCLFMGMNRGQLMSLRNGKGSNLTDMRIKGEDDGYEKVIARLFDFVEMFNEMSLHYKQNPTGAIFVLKNMGWQDTQKIEFEEAPGSLSMEEREEMKRKLKSFSE